MEVVFGRGGSVRMMLGVMGGGRSVAVPGPGAEHGGETWDLKGVRKEARWRWVMRSYHCVCMT